MLKVVMFNHMNMLSIQKNEKITDFYQKIQGQCKIRKLLELWREVHRGHSGDAVDTEVPAHGCQPSPAWRIHERGVLTSLSQAAGLPAVFCLRKPAVVDQRVGFFLEGSSEKLLSLTDVERPTNAGSLLRRTWRGISATQKSTVFLKDNLTPENCVWE